MPNPIEENEINDATAAGLEAPMNNVSCEQNKQFDGKITDSFVSVILQSIFHDFRQSKYCGNLLEQEQCPEVMVFTFDKKCVTLDMGNDGKLSITVTFILSTHSESIKIINVVDITVVNLDYFLERVQECNNRQELTDWSSKLNVNYVHLMFVFQKIELIHG